MKNENKKENKNNLSPLSSILTRYYLDILIVKVNSVE